MSGIHLFSLLCSSESSDNLTALAAQRISVLQKAVKNLSQKCIMCKKRSMVWKCTYLARIYTRIRV